jgi:hypothetical protein
VTRVKKKKGAGVDGADGRNENKKSGCCLRLIKPSKLIKQLG